MSDVSTALCSGWGKMSDVSVAFCSGWGRMSDVLTDCTLRWMGKDV